MDIPLSSDALDLSFHPDPNTNLLAVGLISGKIQLVNYDAFVADPSSSSSSAPPSKKTKHEEAPKLYRKIWASRASKKSCRGLAFSTSGERIYSISKDKGLYATDTETGRVVQSWAGAHGAAPSRVLPVDEGMVVTGDDDGVVRLWDVRRAGVEAVREWDHHFDWITDMVYLEDLPVPRAKGVKGEARKSKTQLKKQRRRARQAEALKQQGDDDDNDESGSDSDTAIVKTESRSRLIVTSGDGSLSSIDLRASGPSSFELSQDQEDELLSITSIRSSTKLVVGTQLGILSLWTPARGLLDHVDRVPGHPASVDTLVTLDADTVLTGSSDGLVRVVQILPSKLLGVIASHDGLPVERMKRKGGVLASIGHSNAVKLTDLAPLLEEGDGEDDDDEEEGGALGIVGLSGSDSDDEDEDEDDDEDAVEQDDFADLQPDANNDEVDDDDDQEDHAPDSDSDVPPPPTKPSKPGKAGKQDFFSDL